MITGELKSQIDRIWDAFWSGGISNPMEVIEQLTYLLFIRRLDELQTLAENKARRLGEPVESPVFPDGDDDKGRSYADYRWSRLKNFAPAEMYEVVAEHVFPHLRTLGQLTRRGGPRFPGQLSLSGVRMRSPRAGRGGVLLVPT